MYRPDQQNSEILMRLQKTGDSTTAYRLGGHETISFGLSALFNGVKVDLHYTIPMVYRRKIEAVTVPLDYHLALKHCPATTILHVYLKGAQMAKG